MPVSHTRRRARLRFVRITCLMVAAALAVPFVQPSAVFSREENPREKGSGAVSGALIVRLRAGVARTEMASVLSRAGATELASMDDPSTMANPPGMASAASMASAAYMDRPRSSPRPSPTRFARARSSLPWPATMAPADAHIRRRTQV